MRIGEKIQRLRTEKGISQKELGLSLGYTKSRADNRVIGYERSYYLPKKETLRQIARVLELNPTVFVGGTPVENVLQHLFWLSKEEREEVIAVMDTLRQKEEELELRNITEDELILWKIKWTSPNTKEESELS